MRASDVVDDLVDRVASTTGVEHDRVTRIEVHGAPDVRDQGDDLGVEVGELDVGREGREPSRRVHAVSGVY